MIQVIYPEDILRILDILVYSKIRSGLSHTPFDYIMKLTTQLIKSMI